MKKSILSLALLAFAGVAAIAQDFKPTSGSKTLELQAASPFASGRPFSIDNIRARYFIADDMAVRVQFGIFGNSTKSIRYEDDPTSTSGTPAQIELATTRRFTNINIKPGIEKHFEGTDRLSPYVGAEVDFAIQTARSIVDSITDKTNSNAIATTTTIGDNGTQKGFIRLGLNVVAGADYYITKNLYLGAEVGWGVQRVFNSTKKVEREGFDDNKAPADEKQGGVTTVGTNFIGTFRLGWAF